jgi:hypothetical protein
MKATVKKIADTIKSGDSAGAKAAAKAAVKGLDDLEPIMHMFKPRKKDGKGGIGWGTEPGANPAKDGLEVRIRDLARDVPAGFAKEKSAAEVSGYWVAAIAELTIAKGWAEKDTGKKTKKAFNDMSVEMRDAAVAFAKAAASGGGQEVKTAADKLNNVCSRCHSIFKD